MVVRQIYKSWEICVRYNKKVLQQHGITVGDRLTFDEFFAAAEKLKAAGIFPLAVGDTDIWATAGLFENTLLGVLGPQGWRWLLTTQE